MNIELKGQSGLEVSQAMRNYLYDSLKEIESVFDGDVRVDAKCKVEKAQQTVEIFVHTRNHQLRVKAVSDSYYDSVDAAVSKLKKNVRKYREKLIDVKRKSKDKEANHFLSEYDEDEIQPGLARVKQLKLDPMSQEEAMQQMELLGHDFFLFEDAASGQPSVLYRRQDESLGMLVKRQ